MLRPTPDARRPSAFIRSLLLLTLLGTVVTTTSAAEILGAHEGWLDRMGAGVRELGRGNTGTALADAAPAAYWNPALLPFHRRSNAAMGGEVRSLDRNGGYLSLQGPVASNLGAGLAVVNRGDMGVRAYDSDERFYDELRPQAFATWFAAGVRTSRRSALGAALQVYASSPGVGDGIGDVDFIGGLNLGWYRRHDSLNAAALFPESWTGVRRVAGFFSGEFSSAVVVRNLGFNPRLSSEFEQSVTGEDVGFGTPVGRDFFPKTLVLAGEWRKRLWNRPWAFAGEVMNYQLDNSLFSADPGHHAQAARLGAEVEIAERTMLRAGLDRLNPTFGFGYTYRWSRARLITFDYALILERGATTFNPYAAGVKTSF